MFHNFFYAFCVAKGSSRLNKLVGKEITTCAGRYGVSPLGGVADKTTKRRKSALPAETIYGAACLGSEGRCSAPFFIKYYFLIITNDFAGTEETFVSVSATVYFSAVVEIFLSPTPRYEPETERFPSTSTTFPVCGVIVACFDVALNTTVKFPSSAVTL